MSRAAKGQTDGAVQAHDGDDPTCVCGHPWLKHNKWWDIGDLGYGGPSFGMGCDLCDCDDSTVGL